MKVRIGQSAVWKLAYLLFAIICTVIVCLNQSETIEAWISFACIISAVSLVVQTIYTTRIGIRLFSVQYIMLILMYVFYMGQNLLLLMDYSFGSLTYSIAYIRYGVEAYIYANKYSMICILATYFGLTVLSTQWRKLHKKRLRNRATMKFYRNLAIVILIVTVPLELLTTGAKILTLLSQGYLAAREVASSVLLQYFSGVFFSAMVILIASFEDRKLVQKRIFVVFIIYQFIGFLTGVRALGVIKIILSVFVYNSIIGQMDFKTIFKKYGLLGIVLVYVLILIRNFRTEGLNKSVFSLATNGNIILDAISEFAITSRVVTAALYNTINPAGGMSLLCGFLSIIPGWTYIFGSGLQDRYYTFYALEQQAWGSSFISDFYFDFGFAGGAIACIFYGMIITMVCNAFLKALSDRNYPRIAVYSYFLLEMIYTIRSYVFRLPRYFVYYLAIFVLFYTLAWTIHNRNKMPQ